MAFPYRNPSATLDAVRAVYAGVERELWELLMGEQIHIAGLASSLALAGKAAIRPGSQAIDLCCCTGAGLRFLLRFTGVTSGIGVDATAEALAVGQTRNQREGVAARIRLVHAEATATGLPAASTDLVWGEDAWCYVGDKQALVREAVRLAKPGGTIAFTDWMWGRNDPGATEAQRFLAFMKFPDLFTLDDYRQACTTAGALVEVAEDTGRFAPALEHYLTDLAGQHAWDALRLIGFDQGLATAIVGEMQHAHQLAVRGTLIQGLVIARKP